VNILNAYLNYHASDEFEFRVGRFFTPFTHDQYAVSNYWLITPERSVFTTNLSPNRQYGAMAWGYLFVKKLDYALGVFNGSRNSFEDPDGNRDVVGFVNTRPFQDMEHLPALRFLNLGASATFGRQNQSPSPSSFRIGGGSPDTNIPGNATVPFLILQPDVSEQGDRFLASIHAAYYYKSLSIIGEYQFGYGHYAGNRSTSTRVPFNGYYVAAGYFLTGEEVQRRTRLRPLRPVFPVNKDDERGWGAWELAGRVANLQIGDEVFTAGFADRSIWSNSVTTTEVGVNWYLNEYVKIYCFWLNGRFGDPVQYRHGRATQSTDMFWLRAQLYF
jgi:phosphate-selective porin OprO/OprP